MLFGKKKEEKKKLPIMKKKKVVVEKKKHFLQVNSVISSYSGYKGSRRKEDDLAIKRRILEELNKGREFLTNILEDAYEKGDDKFCNQIKKAIDQLDVFEDEVDLSESGHNYGFFKKQTSVGGGVIKQLTKFDATLITKMNDLTTACSRLELKFTGGDSSLQANREVMKIKQYITAGRNEWSNRIELLKKI